MPKRYFLSDIIKHKQFPFHIERSCLIEGFYPHVHDFHELMIILKGSAVHTIDGNEYKVQAGDVYQMQEDTEHGFTSVKDLEFYNVMFHLDSDENESIFTKEVKGLPGYQSLFVLEPFYRKEHRFQNHLRLYPTQLDEIDLALQAMLDEYTKGEPGYQTLFRSGFTSVVIKLSRLMNKPEETSKGSLQSISETIAYIETHFTDSICMASLAKRAHLSERHFSRVFSENFQVPPMEYIQHLRLRHACDYLKKSKMRIIDIAQASGYKDGNLFSKHFHQKYALTPSQYRKQFG